MTTSDASEQAIHRNDQLMLFEGIIIGIYGNWLVSLIQLITFSAVLLIHQIALILLSLLSLVILLAVGVFGGKWENHYVVLVLAFLHYVPLCISLLLQNPPIQDLFFLLIGGILFSMIYMAEYARAGFTKNH
jgi:hypothetical protein